MIERVVVGLVAILAATSLVAQNAYAPLPPIPLGDNLLTLPTAQIARDGKWEIRFTHRFSQSADQGNFSNRIHSLFGLDSSADVGIGLSWAPRPDLQLALYRSNVLDDIETSFKYVGFEQARALPVSVAIRGGIDYRSEQNLTDRTSLFAQAIISRQFAHRVEVFIVPTYATKAGRSADGGALFDHAGNVPVGVAFLWRPALSMVGEFVPKNRDLPSTLRSDFGWSVGLKRAIGGHYFEILLTDLQSTHVDQYVTTTYQANAVRRGDLHLGFNIERKFGK